MAGVLDEAANTQDEKAANTKENEGPNISLCTDPANVSGPSGSMSQLSISPPEKPVRLRHPLHSRTSPLVIRHSASSLAPVVSASAADASTASHGSSRQEVIEERCIANNIALQSRDDTMDTILSRSPTPAASDSSEDIVVFKGRGHTSVSAPLPPRQKTVPTSGDMVQYSKYDENKCVSIDRAFNVREGDTQSWDVGSTPWEHRSTPGVGWANDYIFAEKQRKTKRSARREDIRRLEQTRVLAEYKAQQDAVRDYIENIQAHDDDSDDTPMVTKSVQPSDTKTVNFSAGNHESTALDGWNETTIRDLDDISTSSDVSGDVVRILNKRIRPSGVQYLVVYEESGVDDACWLHSSHLNRPAEIVLVRTYEQEHDETLARQLVSESTDSDTQGRQSEYEAAGSDDDVDGSVDLDLDDLEYEDTSTGRHIESLSDEGLARILSVQQSLGLDTDEIVLFDDVFGSRAISDHTSKSNVILANKASSGRSNKRRQRVGFFPDASLMADMLDEDPYNAFDVMDFERPSLKPKKKGRRSDPALDLSDEELAAQIQASWEDDRKKKSLKRIERQQMHKEGLIGKKKNKFKIEQSRSEEPPSWSELKTAIEKFLCSSESFYTFPATLSKTERIFVHSASQMFELESTSRGSERAGNRQLTVTKNSWTIDANHDEYSRKLSQVQRKFFHSDMRPRLEGLGRSVKRGMRAFKDPVGKHKDQLVHGATYSTGEIVGSKAPEIGQDNRGRAMLEKMGWTKGDALGAYDNKGSTDPIAHRFKAGRAGLR
ncbi:hypothetical protein EJ05DRAFT_239424 [Pseudovirgaria hyperparasitica]|uniref:G-patch domain-containing protein n=1 Tax=Pseudovirgaria hyperparasitica TaxID=470096 RepID=A0A6A6WHQ0_9PEZI|nr:uncharacterized protein EJ05DRAFT_239424 [Pseudovirgaria hyperparasitica]KAF2760681.1 hypothetical protein EJ05DRAFT_239424 [Pseudovirgaria hyperparasitica]